MSNSGKQHYEETFLNVLASLNEAQKEAVEHLEGPVLVVAGPGTGKTQILSARIGNLLYSADTQAAPHNILCLTYTEAGTVAMRQRLLEFIGPEAYRVHIYTFHGFCNQVIQDNLDYFGINDLQPISDLETIEVLQDLIDSFHAQHPLKRFTGDVYFETWRLKVLFDMMKKEAWSPEYINEKVDEYLEDLPNREEYIYKTAYKGYKKGDVKVDKVETERLKMMSLRAGAGEYNNYQKRLRDMKRYDFNDMIVWVLEAFKNNAAILSDYQERYLYFLVDEYQDTNGAQNEILKLLTGFWEVPNVFVVGDDDQSIFRFQGANVKNIIDFYQTYARDIKRIVMTENYRSSQPILDTAKTLIDHNGERLISYFQGLSKDLTAEGHNKSHLVKPQIVEYFNTLQEEASIVKTLENLYKDNVDLSTVAVIYRNHRLVENIVKALQQKNIPLNIKQKVNILELPFIKCIINLLTYLQTEYEKPDSAEGLLFDVLHFCFYDIDPRDAALISRECNSNPNSEKKRSWRQLIGSKERMFQLNLNSARAISELEENLCRWTKDLPNLTVQALFEKILTHGGILTYIMNSGKKVWLMEVISAFFDFIKEESSKKADFKVKDLLESFHKMTKHNVPIHVNKIIYSEKGVNFITAHSSKGLEFDHVYLISCTADCWESQRARSSTYSLPDTLTSATDIDNKEEERRLFYVALTRAKKHLTISYPQYNTKERILEKSRFVAEILEGDAVEFKHVSMEDDEVIEYKNQVLRDAEKPKIELLEYDFIKDALKNYKMSVTHLNKFLRCPISFYFENIVKVPTARNETMGFGNAMHFAMNELFRNMVESPDKSFPSIDHFFEYFKMGMRRFHSHFTKKEYDRRVEYAQELLPDFYNNYIATWEKAVKLSYRVINAEINGVPVTGELDKIEFDGNKINVVDYKTGKPDNGKKKINPPNEKEPLGGDYWRQLVFYKLLIEADRKNSWEMVSGELDFLEKDSKKVFSKFKL
ncbi:MAG TPA: ATP-dependent DNA helicase, partial [Cytophagaceae bacterium]